MDSLSSTMVSNSKMAVQMAKFINMRNAKYGTIQECYWDDEIDSVLIPDEFQDEESIHEALNACTQEAWDHVYANRAKYSTRIRSIIEPKDYYPKTKMVVREMTDDDMIQIEVDRLAGKKAEFEGIWNIVKTDIPDRSFERVDDDADMAWDALTKAKHRMTVFMTKKNGRYIPPSSRKVVDPEQQEIEDDIAECEKKFAECEKRISDADNEYWDEKKNECFQEWLREV